MKKVFNIKGKLVIKFSKDAKEQIIEWLDGIDYDYALNFAKEVDCPVFGKAYNFPCVIKIS